MGQEKLAPNITSPGTPELKKVSQTSERTDLETEVEGARPGLIRLCAYLASRSSIPDADNQAEDFANKTIKEALAHLKDFDPNKTRLSSWLIDIAKSIILPAPINTENISQPIKTTEIAKDIKPEEVRSESKPELSREEKEARIARFEDLLINTKHPDVIKKLREQVSLLRASLQNEKLEKNAEQKVEKAVLLNNNEPLAEPMGGMMDMEAPVPLTGPEIELQKEKKLFEEILKHYKAIEKFCFFAARKYGIDDWENKGRDFAHQAIIKAVEEIDTFRGESSIEKWIMAIAYNIIRNEYRHYQQRIFLENNLEGIIDTEALSEKDIIRKIDTDKMRSSLINTQKETFDDYYQQAFSAREIAARSGTTEGGVESKLNKIKKKLRKLYSR